MSEYTASNDTGSFASINKKTRLIDSGTNIQSAVKQGTGQDAFCTSSSGGLYSGHNLELVATTHWQPKMASLNNGANWGTWQPMSSTIANNTTGIIDGVSATGTLGLASLDTTEGLTSTFTSAGAAGNQCGINRATLYTMRKFNPCFKLRFRIDESGANFRFFAGWTGSTSVIGNSDDPLNGLSGFGVGVSTGLTNYRIFHNDASGASVLDDTGIAKDTNYHTIELWADDNSSKFWWSLDGSTPTGVTTDIPAQTTSLSCQFLCTAVNIDAKVLNIGKWILTSDK